MSDILAEECTYFDYSINQAEGIFIESLSLLDEDYENNHYITEQSKINLTSAIGKLMTSLINSLRKLLSDIRIKISSTIRSATYTKKMAKLRKELKMMDRNAIIEVYDVWHLKEYYLKAINNLTEFSKRFTEDNKYTTTDRLEEDLRRFNRLYDEYDKELEEVSKRKVQIQVGVMLEFVDKELSGNTKVIDSLNDAISELDRIKTSADRFEKLEQRIGAKILNKDTNPIHKIKNGDNSGFSDIGVGIITAPIRIPIKIISNGLKTIGMGISKFVKKWVAKFFVIIFAIF